MGGGHVGQRLHEPDRGAYADEPLRGVHDEVHDIGLTLPPRREMGRETELNRGQHRLTVLSCYGYQLAASFCADAARKPHPVPLDASVAAFPYPRAGAG